MFGNEGVWSLILARKENILSAREHREMALKAVHTNACVNDVQKERVGG